MLLGGCLGATAPAVMLDAIVLKPRRSRAKSRLTRMCKVKAHAANDGGLRGYLIRVWSAKLQNGSRRGTAARVCAT